MEKEKPVLLVVIDDDDDNDKDLAVVGENPRPMAGLHDTAPSPFLSKTFDMVEDPVTDNVVSWSLSRNSFIVWEPERLAATLLPKLFKHKNFSSFVRQLHTYGFRKVDPDRWEFANERFLGGKKHLLKDIKRQRNVWQSSQEASEAESLRRERGVLIAEIAKLKQQQQSNRAQLVAMAERMQDSERKQQQLMTFLEGVVKKQQRMHIEQQQQKQLESNVGRKRKLTTDPNSETLEPDGVLVGTETEMEKLFCTMGNQEEGVLELDDYMNSATDIGNEILLEVFLDDEDLFTGNHINEQGDEPEAEDDVKDLVEQMGYILNHTLNN